MGRKDDSSEDDFLLESDDDDDFVSSAPAKAKSPASAKATPKRKKPSESDGDASDSLEDDDDFEQVKKAKTSKKSPAPKPAKKMPAVEKRPTKKEPEKKEPEKPKDMMSQSQAEEEVAKYMRQTNRPYSVLNVFENLHRRIGKTMLTKILDVLVEKGEIKCKTYGKSQIYYYNQKKLPPPCSTTLAQTEAAIQTVADDVQNAERALKEAESVLHGLSNQMTDAELDQQIAEYTTQVATLSATLQRLDDPNRAPVAPEKKKAISDQFTKYKTAWVKRKRIVMDAIDQIAEGMEKKRKDVLDLCGIETDESVGVKAIPSL